MGGLTCAVCGKKGLNPYAKHGHSNQATLDHVVELNRGGKWNDPANFQVACYKCNSNKNATPKKTHLTSA